MRLKLLLLILWMFCCCSVILSQNPFNPTFQNVIPASPEASSITKFGDYPVSLATGIPQINIPLFNYKNVSTGLSFDLSFDYFAGGIKVDEEPSIIGIGWALNAGGVISRNVRGIPDELPGIGFINEASLPQSLKAGNEPGGSAELRPFNRINSKKLDNTYDQFSFNFAGRSGRFILGKNNDQIILGQQKIKISKKVAMPSNIPQLIDSCITSITITDEQGIIYQFNDFEVTTDNSSHAPGKTFTSAWYLSRIISSTLKDTIFLSYENTNYGYYAGLFYQTTMPIQPSGGIQKNESNSSSTSPLGIQGKRLKEIVLPNGVRINFKYSTTQLVDPAYGASSNNFALKNILIYDKNNSRGYNLIQDYSVNRLTLKKVIPINSKNEISDSAYQFEYFGALPDRLSHAQDHWGYCNNNTGNSMFPDEYVMLPGYIGTNGGAYRHFIGGNRDTDPTKVKLGSLYKIIYPSGGYTVFNFEANQAKDNWLNQEIQYTQNFIDTTELYIPINVDPNDPFPKDSSYFTYTGESPDMNFKIIARWGTYEGSNGRIVAELYEQGHIGGVPLGQFIVPYPQQKDVSMSFTAHHLVKGKTYTIVMYSENIRNWSSVVDFDIQEVVRDTSLFHYAHKQPYVGGLRIRNITNYDGASTKPTSIKTFEYLLDDHITTSGTLGTYPVYTYTAYYDLNRLYNVVVPAGQLEPYLLGQDDNYVIRTTSSINELAFSNGSPVLYQRVVERDSSLGKFNGETVYYYTSYKDGHQPAIIQIFPFVPPINASWSYGLLTKKEIYDDNNNLKEFSENFYDYPVDPFWNDQTRIENFRSISVAPVKFIDQSNLGNAPHINPNDPPVYFLMSTYSPQGGRSELKRTTNVVFTNSGTSINTIHSYSYDPEYYYQKSDTTLNSKNQKEIINNYYPADMVKAKQDSNGIYRGMVDKNIINSITSLSKHSLTGLIDSVSTVYKKIGVNTYKPGEIWRMNLLGHNRKWLLFNDYDIHGNLLERQKLNNTKEVFLWGYRGQFPVAKILGSDYKTVSSLIDQKLLDNASNYDDAIVRSELNKIRVGLKNISTLITTYTYSPLYGITSETDAKGSTVYYEYDGFGKLKDIKDNEGEVIKVFKYYYRGSN